MHRSSIVIPCYNNEKTIFETVSSALNHCSHVIVVLDGCTDGSREALAPLEGKIHCLSYSPNKGKGYALQKAFDYARSQAFDYAITMDADGQHFSSDIPLFFKAIEEHYGNMIVGCRHLKQENMPSGNTFANKFSNFWFFLQTGKHLADTQCGYRAYPLFRMKTIRNLTRRYEAELELLVRMTWRNIHFTEIPIKVYYAPKGEQVSHFRKGRDFLRISLLNSFLCIAALVYGHPSILCRKCLSKKPCGKTSPSGIEEKTGREVASREKNATTHFQDSKAHE